MQSVNDYLTYLYYAAIGGAVFGFIAMILAIANHPELQKIRALLEEHQGVSQMSAEQAAWYRAQGLAPPNTPQYPPGNPPHS